MPEPLLEIEQVSVRYGNVGAVFDVSLQVHAGEAVTLLGANGAGKSSLARGVVGLTAIGGHVRLSGQDITNLPAHQISRAGIAYLPEHRGIFPGLTVEENLRMFFRRVGRATPAAAVEGSYAMFPRLAERRRQAAGTLSGGEQQMLALARVLALEPDLVIADETSLGLAPLAIDTVFESLAALKQQGVALLLIEQYAHRALALADTAVILSRGRVLWAGPAAAATDQVLGAYLGTETSQ